MDSGARDAVGPRTAPAGWTGRLIGRADSGRVGRLNPARAAAAVLPVVTILAACLIGQAQAQSDPTMRIADPDKIHEPRDLRAPRQAFSTQGFLPPLPPPTRDPRAPRQAQAQTTITQTADGATWTLTGDAYVAQGMTYTYTLTLTSGSKPTNEYAGFHLPDTSDNQDKLGSDPNDCTSPEQFCISFSGGSTQGGIWNGIQGHDTRYSLLSGTSPHTLTATFTVAADAPLGSTIEFGAIRQNGLPRDDGMIITIGTTPTLSDDATLSALTVNDGTSDLTLAPVFASGTYAYAATAANAVTTVTLTATPNHTGGSVTGVTLGGTAIADTDFTNGITVPSLVEGDNVIVVTVTAEDTSTQDYTVTVTRSRRTTTTPAAPPEVEVPNDWGLIPTGLGAGDKFRLIFLSSTKTDATSYDIADYNSFIQNLAAAGHTDIQTYSAGFRAVGCTADSDARDNTATTGTGEVIHWLNGNKVADNYADFYDGDWDDEANDKLEDGTDGPDTSNSGNYPLTGCDHDGTEAFGGSDLLLSGALGTGTSVLDAFVTVGRPNSSDSGDGPLSSINLVGINSNQPMYGLSQVFEVATTPGVTISETTLTVTEDDSAGDTYTVVLDSEPTANVVIEVGGHATTDVTAAPASLTFTTTNWETAQEVTVTAGDDANTADETVNLTHAATSNDSDYSGITIAGVTVTAEDNDTAKVTGLMLTPGDGELVANWTAVTAATGYEVQWKSGGQSYNTGGRQAVVASGSTVVYTIPNLSNGTTYTVRVRGTQTGAGAGAYSDEAMAAPAVPAVTTVSISADKTSAVFREDGITYTLTRSGSTTDALDVSVTLTQTKDFLLPADLPQTVTIAAGQSTGTFTVAASSFQHFAAGTTVEAGTLTAAVQDGADYDLGTTSAVDVPIVIGVMVRFEMASYTVGEAAGTLPFKLIARTGAGAPQPSAATGNIVLSSNNGSAINNTDFVFSVLTFDLLPGGFSTDGGRWKSEFASSVTLTDDGLDEDGESFDLKIERDSSALAYSLVDASGNSCGSVCTVTVTITDDDTAGVTVLKTALTVTEDDTAGDTYTVVLDSQPTADVTITVGGYTGSDVTPNPDSLVFTTQNWRTARTVTVTAVGDADTTDDTVTLTHTATSTDPNYAATAASVTVTVEETAEATGQPAISGGAQVGKTLTAEIGTIADTDGLPSTFPDDYTLQWRRVDADGVSNETDIMGETSGTYTVDAADVGKKIKVQASFTDGGSNAEGPLTSAAYPSNAPVAAAAGACPAGNDWCTTLTVGFGDGASIQTYGFGTSVGALADTTIDDGDGTTWTVSTMGVLDYVVAPNDVVQITLDAFLPRGSVFDLGGTTFTADEVSESTTAGTYVWSLPGGFAWVDGQDVTVSVTLPANAPATGAPEISGKPQVGATLSAGTTGIMDLDGLTSVSYAYQWIRVDVDGTSNPVDVGTDDEEYTLAAADEGKRIKVQVTFTDDDSNAEELTSEAYLTPSGNSYPDRGIMPALSACPASNEWCATMTVGFQLPGTDNTEFGFSTAAYGALDDTSFDYDGSTFTIAAVGIRNPDGVSGYHVRLHLDAFVPENAVFELNGYTFTADAASKQSTAGRYQWALPAGFRIAEGVDYRVSLQVTENTPAAGKPTISGPAQAGRTLTAATADITDTDGLTMVSYEYEWLASGTVIALATSSTYTPTSSVQGDKIAVRVTFEDDAGNAETLTSDETIPVAPAAATCPTDAATIWCTTLTVGHGITEEDGLVYVSSAGYSALTGFTVYGSLGDATFEHLGVNYTVTLLSAGGTHDLYLVTTPNLPADGAGLTVHVQTYGGELDAPLAEGVLSSDQWHFQGKTNTFSTTPLSDVPMIRLWNRDGRIVPDADLGTEVMVRLSVVNSAPDFGATTAMRDLAENTGSAQNVGAVLTATDSDGDTLTYSLEGADAASFGIDSGSGQIFTIGGVNFDHETKSTYTVVVKADDSNGGTDTIEVTISITDVNEPPAAPAAPTVSAVAGSTTSLTVNWNAPANTGPPIDDYDLRYRQGTSGNFTNGPQNVSGTPATIENLLEDTLYQVQVQARNDEGTSGWSPSGSGRTSGGDNTATVVTILASSSSVPFSTFHDATFTVLRTGLLTDALTVTVNLTQDRPFLEASERVRTVTIGAGSSGQNLVVSGTQLQLPVTDRVETGTLTATVAPGTGYDIGSDASASVDIVPFMTVRLEMASYTVSEDVGSLSVKVIARTGNGGAPPSSPFDISISTESDTAGADEDYSLFSVQPTFQPGTFSADGTAWKAEKTVEVTILDDTLDEPDEAFRLELERQPGLDNRILIVNSAGAAPANLQQSTVTIVDDDLPSTPTVRFGASAYTSIEGLAGAVVTVLLEPAASSAVTVPVTATLQDGASSADYDGVPESVTFDAGETVQTFTVTATGDSVDDEGESLQLGFGSPPSGVLLGSPSTARVALVQDADVSTWYVWFGESSYTVTEGGTARISVHLNSPWKPERNEALTVPLFDPEHQGGASADDYSGLPESVTFPPGQTQVSFTVRVIDDSDDDDGESVLIQFRRWSQADLEPGRYGAYDTTLHIADNDGEKAVTVSFDAANYTAVEGGATATVRVRLDTAPGRSVTIPLTKTHRGATAADYSGLPGSVTFGASETQKTLTVTATDDQDDDDRESVAIGFGSLPSKVSAGSPSEAVLQLTDNDQGHTSLQVRFDAPAGAARAGVEEGGSYRVGIRLSAKPGKTLTIPLTYAYLGGATAADFSNLPANVTFGANATSAGVTIRPVDDFEEDPGESLKVSFGSLPGGVSVGASGRSTDIPVTDNDATPGLSVSDASAREWPNKKVCLVFVVTMDLMDVDHEVSVDYATRNGTAVAEQDFKPISGTLVFRPAESKRRTASKSLCVEVIDDSHDEGLEEMTLVLSNPVRAYLIDGTGTGSISNTDKMPGAWLTRFGRAATDHVVEAVGERWQGGSQTPHLTLGGRQAGDLFGWAGLRGRSGRDTAIDRDDPAGTDPSSMGWLAPSGGAAAGTGATAPGMPVSLLDMNTAPGGAGGVEREAGKTLSGRAAQGALLRALGLPDSRAVPDLRTLLMGSSFFYSAALDEDGESRSPQWLGQWSAWGRTASSRFSGADGNLRLDGEVATAMLGFDSRWERWLAGVVVSFSEGQGGYTHPTASGGAVASTMTGLNPYLRFELNERTSFWGVLGYGAGDLSLTPARSDTALGTDLTNAMAAFGGRTALSVRTGEAGRFKLAVRSDARLTNTVSESIEGLVGTAGQTGRVRLMLEGSGSMRLATGGVLKPTLEAGLRYDTGDAETGAGLEVSGGLGYAARRLSVEVNARGLVAHEDTEYEEWGFSGSIAYTPSEDGRGLSMRLGSAWGATQSGVQSLWSRQDASGLVSNAAFEAAQRYQVELRYGLDGKTGRARWEPFVGVESAAGASRALRLGVKLTSGRRLDAGLEFGRRQGRPGTDPEHAVQLRGAMRW